MNAQVILAPVNPMAHRIAENLRYHDIASLGRDINGGSLGIDYNRKFSSDKGPTKVQFANWLVTQSWWDNDKALQLLPELEKMAGDYYAQRGKPRTNIPRNLAPIPPPQTPVTVPGPVQPQTPSTLDTEAVARIAQAIADKGDTALGQAMTKVIRELEAKINQARPLLIKYENTDKTVQLDRQHKDFLMLLRLAKARSLSGDRYNVWMTGPAGSGKTTGAMNVAKALDLPFHFCGAINDEYKLLGYMDAQGRLIRTPFREAFEYGGVFLLDEVDGCSPAVLLALNAALANGMCDFADGNVKRHKDCVIMAAANTWGLGASHKYVGRNKLDAASLDRFKMLAWDYDEAMERDLSGNLAWAKKVQAMRANLMAANIEAVISPRATYDGAAMMAQGFSEAEVMQVVVRKGLSDIQWQQVTRGVQ